MDGVVMHPIRAYRKWRERGFTARNALLLALRWGDL